MRRVVCVYWPHWPLQRRWHETPALRQRALAIVGRLGRLERVLACGRRARRAGVRPGLSRAEALAILPSLTVMPDDPEGDRRALERLAGWAERFSPLVGLEETVNPASLLLDVTGGTACFGGEAALAAKVRRGFTAAGWQVRVALADTVGLAWACAVFGDDEEIVVPTQKTAATLLALPLAALRLPHEAVGLLRALGIVHVGDVTALPRAGLAARFGATVLHRLDQALGRAPEPITPHRPMPTFSAAGRFPHPTDQHDALRELLRLLTRRLTQQLEERLRGARRIEVRLFCEAARPLDCDIELHRPSRCPRRLAELLATRLERIQLPGLLTGVRLDVTLDEPLTAVQTTAFDAERPRLDADFAALVDGLSSRLGRTAVTVPRLVDDAQPEYACRFDPAVPPPPAAPPPSQEEPRPWQFRPIRLWPRPVPVTVLAVVPPGRPQRIRTRHGEGLIRRCWGPERIATGWWRGADVSRDYFIVDIEQGGTWWIYRRLDDGCWFWHGCFD